MEFEVKSEDLVSLMEWTTWEDDDYCVSPAMVVSMARYAVRWLSWSDARKELVVMDQYHLRDGTVEDAVCWYLGQTDRPELPTLTRDQEADLVTDRWVRNYRKDGLIYDGQNFHTATASDIAVETRYDYCFGALVEAGVIREGIRA